MPALPAFAASVLLSLGGCDPARAKTISVAERLAYLRYGTMLTASTAFLTFITASAMQVAIGNTVAACFIALMLGCVVLGIDATILHSEARQDGYRSIADHGLVVRHRATESGWKKLAGRIALSVMLCSFVVSLGELRFYETEIRAELHERYVKENAPLYAAAKGRADAAVASQKAEADKSIALRDDLRSQNGSLDRPFDPASYDRELTAIDGQISAIGASIAALRATSVDALQESVAETAGRKRSDDSTGLPGKGPRYRAALGADLVAQTRAAQFDHELEALRVHKRYVQASRDAAGQQALAAAAATRPQIVQNLHVADLKAERAQAKLASLQQDRVAAITREMAKDPAYVQQKEGLLARADAYQALRDKSPAAWVLSWLAKIAVILLETMAVVVRVLTRGPSHAGAIMVLDTDLGIGEAVSGHVSVTGKIELDTLNTRARVTDAKIALERKETDLAQARSVRKFVDDLPSDS